MTKTRTDGVIPAKAQRQILLERAIELTTQTRDKVYGPPERNMACFARFVNGYLDFHGNHLTAHDAAMIMVLSKVARIAAGSKFNEDNYVDGAAYLAIAAEVSKK